MSSALRKCTWKDFWERKGDFLHQQKAYLCHVWRRTARFLYCLLHDAMNHWPWLTSGLWCCLHLAANLNWKWISLAVSILFGILWPARLSKSKLFKHCPRSNNTSLWLQIWTPTLFFNINLSISIHFHDRPQIYGSKQMAEFHGNVPKLLVGKSHQTVGPEVHDRTQGPVTWF